MQLYQHQKDIIAEDLKKTGLFLGTGSGKTLTALMLAEGSTLVICPKTQKEDKNWEREFMRMHHPIVSTRTTEERNLVVAYRISKLTIISKEEFRRDWEELPRFDTVIVDETHTCLGVTPNTRQRKKQIIPKASQLYEALDEFIKKTNPDRIYLCTATIMRSPMTVWGASQILGYKDANGDAWDFYDFRRRFYTRLPMPGREVYQAKSDDATKDMLASLVKKLGYTGRLEDFFDVPAQTYKTINVELSELQKMRIKDMSLEYPEPIVRVGKIHQIENGVLAGDEFSNGEHFHTEKLDKIWEISLEFPRFIIFAKYRAQIDAIAASFREKGKNVLTLTGDTKDRGEVILTANKAKECVFIAQAQISAGWELPEYPCMVFASRTYSFVDYDQAIGRIQRANNIKKNLYIHLVVKGGVDEAVHDTLENKKDFNERIYAEKK